MNEIRKNKEEEKTIATVKCKMPTLIMIFYTVCISFILIMFISAVIILSYSVSEDDITLGSILLTFSMLFGSPFVVMFVLRYRAIKNTYCELTNKRIKGSTVVVIRKIVYSYRLDEIDNVEIQSTVGMSSLVLHFLQNQNGYRIFSIRYLENMQEVYNKLSELLTSVKSQTDLKVDIEMSKVDAENRKAAAFEFIASNMIGTQATAQNNSDYIGKIKALKELLDCGAISQAEFDEKKAELLKNG